MHKKYGQADGSITMSSLDAIDIKNIRASLAWLELFEGWYNDFPTTVSYLLRRLGLDETLTGQEAALQIKAAVADLPLAS